MTPTNITRVVLTGNLTQDPELRSTPDGIGVCSLRIACNARRKDAEPGRLQAPSYPDHRRHRPVPRRPTARAQRPAS
jgi:single-strand DNA-binding protein